MEILAKLAIVEQSLKALEEKESESEAVIEKLKKMNENHEKQSDELENFAKQLNKIEEKLVEKDILIINLQEKVQQLEEKQLLLIEEGKKYHCNKCDFKTFHKTGLKIHKTKKHGFKTCELCEEIFYTVRKLKIHKYTHSFTSTGTYFSDSKQTCKTCKFECKTVETMEVHLGKCRSENFECGLCEANFEDLKKLELHLNTCEVYECDECNKRVTNLSDLKEHIQSDHKSSTRILYLKIDRNDPSEVKVDILNISDV